MGGGTYCSDTRATRSLSMGYATKPVTEIFTEKQINNAMSPHGVAVRESRDSEEHPESLALMIALDVTGSMGTVPHHLVKTGLPDIMTGIIGCGILHPQVLFLGIGDHECDKAPLQVSQFESSDDLLDKWLTTVYLEGGGGGNAGESYMLAWYFAALHTSIDCWEKRQKKGFLFTIGDEPVLPEVPQSALKGLMGDGQYETYRASDLLNAARETYEVYHINICETAAGSRRDVIEGWKQLIGDHLLLAKRHEDVSKLITDIVTGGCNVDDTQKDSLEPEQEQPAPVKPATCL